MRKHITNRRTIIAIIGKEEILKDIKDIKEISIQSLII